MKKFIIGTSMAALLATTAWSALAQSTPETSPPPAQQQVQPPLAPDDTGDSDGMAGAGQGWGGGQGGQHGKRWMHGRHQGQGGMPGMEGMQGRGMHGMGMHGMRGHGEMRGMRGMAMIDANNDNIIGDSEAASLADRGFMRLDRDGSGDLDEGEFTTVRKRGGWWKGWTAAQGEGISEGLKAKFATLDADKNAKVSKAEYMADARARFTAADTDKDGKVSPWEFYAQN